MWLNINAAVFYKRGFKVQLLLQGFNFHQLQQRDWLDGSLAKQTKQGCLGNVKERTHLREQ